MMGGQAMRLQGMPRFSMDWDLFIPARDGRNLAKLNAAVGEELGEEILPLGPRGENFVQTFQTREGVVPFHLGVPGVPVFDEAERRSVCRPTGDGRVVPCLCGRDWLAAKEAAGRPQDQLDIQFLRELERVGRLD